MQRQPLPKATLNGLMFQEKNGGLFHEKESINNGTCRNNVI